MNATKTTSAASAPAVAGYQSQPAAGSGSDTSPGTASYAATTVYSRPRPALPITGPITGVTLDSTSNLSAIVTSLKSIAKVPTTRIVFDEWVPASNYRYAASQIRNVSYVMGELLDSYYVRQYTVQQYLDRTREYLSTLGDVVDIWEVGNEINGEWLGTTSDVVAKMSGAYDLVKAQGKSTELTLYYNEDCWAKPANEMFTWAQANVPDRMKQGLDYVLVSYYEDDCNGLQPDWNAVFTKLHAMFPNSKIGFGEVGTSDLAKKASYMKRYYSKVINVPGYVGGYFWWYGRQDLVPNTQPLLQTLNDAILSVPAGSNTGALTTPSPTPTTTTAPTPAPAPAPTTTSPTTIPLSSTNWTTISTGSGSVTYDATYGILLNPKAPTTAYESYGARTLINNQKLRNFRLSLTATTEAQLRLNSAPNPWEVMWIYFNYNPTTAGKKTNYFLLKPNGIELGTANDGVGQAYLQTGPTSAAAIGASNRFDIEKVGNRVTVSINGVKVTDYTGSIFDVVGSIGMHAESSRVRITNVQVTPLP